MNGKVIIVSAPSGSGKTTIIQRILSSDLNLEFSVSACSRPKRGKEKEGVDYYFLTVEDFKKKIDEGAFLEWEEVYENQYYGTLKSEVERICNESKNPIFDVDVLGGLSIKKYYGNHALSIFVKPPSLVELERRLRFRSTDSSEAIAKRINKAKEELTYANSFDTVIINDDLETAVQQAFRTIRNFLTADN